MKKKSNSNVCPICRKKIATELKLYPQNREDRTVCERCGRYCHSDCVVRVRDSYLLLSALEYSVCKKCYPEIEDEDRLNRSIGDGEGYEEYLEGGSRKLEK
jgi:hypothetical protein